MSVPSWWMFVLLSLAAFRVYRLIGKDTILDPIRAWVLRLPVNWKEGDRVPPGYRDKLGTFLLCPWCAGFWISGLALVAYSLVTDWFEWFSFLVVWFALSAVVALIEKALDEE